VSLSQRSVASTFARTFLIQGSWNYHTMLGTGFSWALLPALRRLHRDDPEALAAALARHVEHFNAHPYLVGVALGAVVRLESEGERPETVSRFKTAVRGPLGNRHPRHAPHGIYPANGEDQWIAIAVTSEDAWRSVCDVLGLGDLTALDEAERKSREAEIDGRIAAVTRNRSKAGLAASLVARGVAAAAVHDAAEVAGDAALRARGHLVRVVHPEAGAFWQSALPVRFGRTPPGPVAPAPLHGEHSFTVFERLLGMSRAEYDALVAAEISGEGPPANVSVASQA